MAKKEKEKIAVENPPQKMIPTADVKTIKPWAWGERNNGKIKDFVEIPEYRKKTILTGVAFVARKEAKMYQAIPIPISDINLGEHLKKLTYEIDTAFNTKLIEAASWVTARATKPKNVIFEKTKN